MKHWKKVFFLTSCILLILVINAVDAFGSTPFSFPIFPQSYTSDTLTCDDYEGAISFSYSEQNNPLEYSTQFFLTDTNTVILQIRDTSYFSNVLEGCYFIYALENKVGVSIDGNIIGNRIGDIISTCFTLSAALPLTICPKPDAIKIVSGKVFNDINEDGLDNDAPSNLIGVAIKIYEDNNQDGLIDIADSLLATTTTNVIGEYSYTIDETPLERLVTHVLITSDTSTIPSEKYYTTDNIEAAIFSRIDGIDSLNNFGISQIVDLENEVWLDINGNGIQESIEVNIPNMELCLINLSPLLIDGILYPINTYRDTVLTDENGIFEFENLPDGNWQIIAHQDTSKYIPTYDVDGDILDITNFNLTDGAILPTKNSWCTLADCIGDIKFGFRLAGDLILSGNVCIDDGSKDGNCSTGTEEQLASIVLTLFNEAGDKLGGVRTNEDGNYLFPNLFEDNYVVHFTKEQISFKDYFFTTKLGTTPASIIVDANKSILQKVLVQEDIYGLDFAFFPHTILIANDDEYTLCPGVNYGNKVSLNDTLINNLSIYELLIIPSLGITEMDVNGTFNYIPSIFECSSDQFTYRVCDLITDECDTATVYLVFEDETPPDLFNIPFSTIMNCDEQIPEPGLVSTFDNCPRVGINIKEVSNKGEDGCSQYDYTLERTWTATDLCGNSKSATQIIKVEDEEAPGIFRIYTLPSGKKMVAGTIERTGNRWKTVRLPIDFETTPLIFNQIVTDNEDTPIIVQTRKISKSQFEIRLQKEENNHGKYAYEKVAWIAIEKGNQHTNFIVDADFINADSDTQTFNFSVDFSSPPLFFSSLQTTNEQDPVMLVHNNLTASGATVQLREENSKDLETVHAKEKLAYLGIENVGDLLDNNGNIIGEVGTIEINNDWNSIALNHTYHNPIILVNNLNGIADFPYNLRVKEVSTSSFNVKVQSWEHLDAMSEQVTMSYLVLEGSIPLYSPDFCLTNTTDLKIGIDIVAVDNCDNSVELAYSDQRNFNGIEQIVNRTWKSSDECGNEVAYSQRVICEGVAIKLQTFLQGALLGSEEEGLMRDDLRRKGFLPKKEPYSALSKFKHVGSGGGEVLKDELLNITGSNAIVDWVFLELRDEMDIDIVIATSSGLVQRDGDIISSSGDSLIVFENVPFGNYYIAVQHRNHIGLNSKEVYTFDLNTIPKIDFRNVFTAVNGNYPTIKLNNRSAQWSGDINGDGKTIYQGPQNDPFEMFLQVLLDDGNSHFLTNYISRGYSNRDFNMDGITIYQGPNNDRSLLLYNTILIHPNNKTGAANYIISVLGNE